MGGCVAREHRPASLGVLRREAAWGRVSHSSIPASRSSSALGTASGARPVVGAMLRRVEMMQERSTLDANDVVMSYVVQWDASHPAHVGNTGAFSYFSALWGGFLNAPPAEG